jgi:hypothetical protein
MSRVALVVIVASLGGCTWEGSIGRPPLIAVPAGDREVVEPNGSVIVEPEQIPIETVITGLSQAQTVRTLTRALAR